jgi:hypothetical protein
VKLEASRGAVSQPEYHGPALLSLLARLKASLLDGLLKLPGVRTAIVTRHARRGDLEKERMDLGRSFEPDASCQGFMSDSDEEIDGKERAKSVVASSSNHGPEQRGRLRCDGRHATCDARGSCANIE